MVEGDTVFPDPNANPPERTITRDLLRGLYLPRDQDILAGKSARYSYNVAAHHLVKTGVWLEHALEGMTEDNKKLEEFVEQTKDLEKRLSDTEVRAKRAEEEASEAKRLRADSDRLRESAETALVIEKSAREALKKKHAEDMQGVEAENKRLVEQVQQLDQDLLKVEVHTFTLG